MSYAPSIGGSGLGGTVEQTEEGRTHIWQYWMPSRGSVKNSNGEKLVPTSARGSAFLMVEVMVFMRESPASFENSFE